MGKPLRKLRHDLAYIIFTIVLHSVFIIPRFIGIRLFSFIGFLSGFLLIPYRKTIKENLDFIYGDTKSAKEKRDILNGVFINIGITLFDSVKLPSYHKEKFLEIVKADLSEIKEVHKINKDGIVMLGAHSSCFELQPHIFVHNELPMFVIGAPLFDQRIDDKIVELRKRNGVTYYNRNGAGRAIIKELRNNSIFGALIDQDATNDGVFAHFLDKLAFTPTGPIRLALKIGAPIYPAFISREKDYTYKLHIGKREDFNKELPIEDTILRIAEETNKFLSDMIHTYPTQWVWMHKRWNRKREDYPNIISVDD